MAIDSRKLRPSELCGLLNSTSLGEVINERQLKRQRTRAGLRIGDSNRLDLLRYVAWLVQERHAPKSTSVKGVETPVNLAEAALGAAALGSRSKQIKGHGQKLTSKQELLIAALLTEPTYAAAAFKARVAETTIYRWLELPRFRKAYRRARREIVEAAIGRIQAATGQAVETLVTIARQGRRDGDRIRASMALLDHACRGLEASDTLHGEPIGTDSTSMNTSDVVSILATRLRQVDQSELATQDKSRLTAALADAFLRAIGVDVLDKRLEALQAVLLARKEKGKK